MKLTVRVKANARKNEIKQLDENSYHVSVTAPPVDGKANKKVIEILSEYFRKPKRCFIIVKGAASKEKIIEVVE